MIGISRKLNHCNQQATIEYTKFEQQSTHLLDMTRIDSCCKVFKFIHNLLNHFFNAKHCSQEWFSAIQYIWSCTSWKQNWQMAKVILLWQSNTQQMSPNYGNQIVVCFLSRNNCVKNPYGIRSNSSGSAKHVDITCSNIWKWIYMYVTGMDFHLSFSNRKQCLCKKRNYQL